MDLVVRRTDLSQNQGQVRFVPEAFIHPLYHGPDRTNAYDVAVLKLERAVTGIQPIKLATAKQNNVESPGSLLRVAGWGTTREGANITPNRMREASVPVVPDSRAREAYASVHPYPDFFPSLMVAAGKEGKDTCQGDSGGPLFSSSGGPPQVGITSVGFECGRAGYPGVYTEINNPEIRRFILDRASL